MRVSTERLQSLRRTVNERQHDLTLQEMDDMIENGKEKYPWMKTMDNVRMMVSSRNDEKRLLLPMPESDQVLTFLDTISNQVSELVTQRDKEVNSDITFYDGGESVAFQSEIKGMFIDTLRGFIQNRKIPEYFDFENEFVGLKKFDIESLYRFLLEVSQRSDEEKKEFILEEIPSFPWDDIESTFGESRKQD